MARKPARIGWIEHRRLGLKVALRLNKNTMTFEAEFNGQTYSSKDGGEVKKLVLAAMESAQALEFHPVIRLRIKAYRYSNTSQIDADLTRFYYARQADGTMLHSRWEDSDGRRVSQSHKVHSHEQFDKLPHRRDERYGDTSTFLLSYSEETWEDLLELADSISGLKDRIAVAVESGDAQVVLGLATLLKGAENERGE